LQDLSSGGDLNSSSSGPPAGVAKVRIGVFLGEEKGGLGGDAGPVILADEEWPRK
jgi:hypothetical protein